MRKTLLLIITILCLSLQTAHADNNNKDNTVESASKPVQQMNADPSVTTTPIPPPQGKLPEASVKWLNNDTNPVIGLTYSDLNNGSINLSGSTNQNLAGLEFNITGRAEPYLTTGLKDTVVMEILVVYHQGFNKMIGMYVGGGYGWSYSTYTFDQWRTQTYQYSNIILAYTAGLEVYLAKGIYLKAGYRDGGWEAGVDIVTHSARDFQN